MINDFKTYQSLARTTAQYPSEFGLGYCVLGLAGEWGEVREIFTDKDKYRDELGDVCWYLSNVFYELGEDMSLNMDIIDKTITLDQAVFRLCEATKKIIRGGRTLERKDRMLVYLHTILAHIHYILADDFWKVLEGNINKLQNRQKEGTIKDESKRVVASS